MKRLLLFGLLALLTSPAVKAQLNLSLNLTLQTDVTCAGDNNGLAVVAALGGVPPYVYVWSNGTLGPVNANLSAGVYTVTVTDLLNASATLNVTIDEPDPLVVQVVSQTNVNCNNLLGSATVSVSGGEGNKTILWSNGTVGLTANNLTAGVHLVTVTDENLCIETAVVTIQADINLPEVEIIAGADLQIDCGDPQLTIDADVEGNALGFLWTTLNGNIVSGANAEDVIVDAAGLYTLVVTDNSNGCTNILNAIVTADLTLPTVNINASANVDLQLDCLTPQLTLSGAGSLTGPGISYLWTTLDGHIVAGANTLNSVVVDAEGTYTLQVTNAANQCTNTATVDVFADLSIPSVQINAGAGIDLQIDCLTPQITVDATANTSGNDASYQWTTLNGHILGQATVEDILVDSAGLYLLVVTDLSSGCTSAASVNVSANLTIPQASATVNGQLNCNNSTLTINGSASSTGLYVWTTVDGNIVSGGNSHSPTVNEAGVYVLVVTDLLSGCTDTTSVTVAGTASLQVSIANLLDITCFGALTGGATLQVQGGSGGYTYLWSNGAATASVSGLAAGNYTATVTDNQGCQAVVQLNLSQPAQLTATVSTSASTPGGATGTAVLQVSGGTSPYTYNWSNGMTGASVQGLGAGNYTVTVTDQAGCSISLSVVIGSTANCTGLSVSVQNQNASCNQSNGGATVTVTGGTAPFNYSWSNGSTNANLTNMQAGTYILTVSDAQGCTAVGAAVIVSLDQTPPVVLTQSATLWLDATGNASLTTSMVNSGTYDACGGQVNLSVNTTSFNCNMLGVNTVTLTATDQSGNTATATATVMVIDTVAPTLTCPADMVLNTCGSAVTYNMPSVTDNCDAGNASVMLMSGLASGSIFPLGATTVTYAALTGTGGLTTCSFTVTVNAGLNVAFDVTAPACPGGTDGSITANVSGGSGNYTYLWMNAGNQTGATATGLSAGNYALVVTDDQGCASMHNTTITGITGMDLDLVLITDDCDGMGSIDITLSGGTSPYTYVWMNANGQVVGNTEDLTNVVSGDYTLMITDANGCTYTSGVITVDLSTGVVDAELESFGVVSVYPNPTVSGAVTFDITLQEPASVLLEVYNQTGQLVQTKLAGVLQSEKVALQLASKGNYLVKVVTPTHVYAKKVIFVD